MATQRRTRQIASVMVAFAIFAIYLWAVWTKAMRPTQQPATWFTVQQIATRAEPICRLLSADAGALQQVTEQCTVADRTGRRQTVCVVDSENKQGQLVVHTVWDAASGRLMSAAHILKRGRSGQSRAAVTGKPAETAYRWLELLGVARQPRQWQIATVAALDGRTWKVVMQSDTESATVLFDRDTNDLIQVAIR